MKKISLSIAVAALISMTSGTACFAAELPNFEAMGLPISTVQVQVLGAAGVQEQAPVATAAVSPHQLGVLSPRIRMTTATAAPATGLSTN